MLTLLPKGVQTKYKKAAKLPSTIPFLDSWITIRTDSHHKIFKNSIHVTALVILLLSGRRGVSDTLHRKEVIGSPYNKGEIRS
jgi:hypothetical protein